MDVVVKQCCGLYISVVEWCLAVGKCVLPNIVSINYAMFRFLAIIKDSCY